MYQHDRTLEEKWWFYVEIFGGGGISHFLQDMFYSTKKTIIQDVTGIFIFQIVHGSAWHASKQSQNLRSSVFYCH